MELKDQDNRLRICKGGEQNRRKDGGKKGAGTEQERSNE
jgi:hypothetical protein